MRALTAIAVVLLTGTALTRAAVAETIEDAMASTYATNPTLQAQRSALRATDEGAAQAGAGWRPTVQFVGNYGKAIQNENAVAGVSVGETEPLTPNTETAQILQPLYLGGRIESQIQSAEALVKAGRAQLVSTEAQVLLQGATAFMDTIRDEAILGLNDSNVEVLRKQLEATQDRFRVGELTRTDVAQSEAALQGAIAARVQAQGTLIQDRTNYLRVVGRLPEKLVHPLALPPLPANEADATEIAFKSNADLLNATYTEESASYNIATAFGALLPSVSLEGDLIRAEDQQVRDLVIKTAQVLAKVTIPLYQSGAEYSLVRQKKDLDSQAKLQVAITRDQVRQAVTAAWAALETARAQITSLREQVRAAEITLDGTIQQAQVGTSTTLDVLTAEQVRLQAQTNLVSADHDEYVAAYTLRQALGDLNAQALSLQVQQYDPTVHYNAVRRQLIGTTPANE
jgi:outer membrane protein